MPKTKTRIRLGSSSWISAIPSLVMAAAVLIGLVLAPTAAAARPAELVVEHVSVRLTVYRGGERTPDGSKVPGRGSVVEAVAEYELDRAAEPGERLVLLNFAESMPKAPVELDEVALATYLDGPFDRGELSIDGAWGVSAIDREGPHRHLVISVAPGHAKVTLRYRVKVPHRYWPLGCIRRRCSLSGAIAPLPSAPAEGGRWLPPSGRVVRPARWSVESARLASAPGWVPGSAPTTSQAKALRGEELVVVAPDETKRAEYPSVFWGRKWHRLRRTHRGVLVEILHRARRLPDRVPRERAAQLYRDVPGHVETIATQLIELLDSVGMPQTPDTRITVVQGPLRSQIAEFHPDTVVVSDYALQLFPAQRFLRFHHVEIARAMLDMLLHRRFIGAHDPSTDLWLPGSTSFALLQLWAQRREHPDEFAPDILRNFTFVPAVDRFIYTGQATFSQAYFRGSEDAMPVRNHPLWFANGLPTGRRIHEKLVDTLSADQLDAFYRALARDRTVDPRAAAEQAYGRRLGWFFDQWLGPYPSVDYAVVDVRSERAGSGWRHTVTIEKIAARPVVEPVQVLVTERDGEQHFLVWNGQLDDRSTDLDSEPRRGSYSWTLETDSRIDYVRIDPRNRNREAPQPPHENVDPLFNNRRPSAFRFLYTGAGLDIAASEFINAGTAAARFNAISGFVFFEGSLRRDLRRTGHLQLSRTRETNLGLGTAVNFRFGHKVNRLRRRGRVRLFTGGSWLNSRSLDPRGGLRLVQELAVIDETRKLIAWPERGRRLTARFGARQTLRVDDGPNDHRYELVAGGGWSQLWPIAHDHVLASSVAANVVMPLVRGPEFRALSRAGGIGGLSGYAADEIFGLGVFLTQLEYRHVYFNNMRVNLAHLGWLRSAGGALFSGVASVSRCEELGGWFGRESWYAHVGYAVQAYLQILGVTPQLFRLEAAVPLVRRDPVACLGQMFPNYLAEVQGLTSPDQLLPPFNVNVVFLQPF